MFDGWLLDFRYAFRRLRQSPLFVVTAALSLAIGIGANTAIFSLGSALLLRPAAAVADPARLVDIGRTEAGSGFDTVSYPNYRDLRARTRTLQDLYAYNIEPSAMSLGLERDAERVYGTVVSANFFDVLGVRPSFGRLLHDADDGAGAQAVAVLSDDLWRRRFGANPGIVGQSVNLNGAPFTVVGIAPSGFSGTTVLKTDLWVPLADAPLALPRLDAAMLRNRGAVWLMMGARLKSGVTLAQANADLATAGSGLEREFPDANRGKNYRAVALSQFPGRASVVAGFLGLLTAIVGLVLLIACVNLAGMLLARAAGRQHEIAVRLAIGATRARLARLLLTETGALCLAGGAAGLLLSRWLLHLLLALVPQLPVPVELRPTTDWRVISFAALLSLLAAVLSGLAPALQSSSGELVGPLKAAGHDALPARMRLRDVFVAGQVAMSLLLVIIAGLFVRAIGHAAQIDPGFDQANVEVITLDLSLGGYKDATGARFLRELLQRVQALPAVEAATATADLPLDGGRMGIGALNLPGVAPLAGTDRWAADANIVEPGFFRTLKLPLLRGRDFSAADTAESQPVAIVNQALAKRFWPGQDAMGQRMELQPGPHEPARMLTIVGVTGEARLMSLNEPAEPYFYVPLAQSYIARVSLLVRTRDGRSVVPQVREMVRAMNPNLPLVEALPLADVTAVELVPQHIAAAVAGSLGVVGLLLAAIGIYGVTAYAVSRRGREIAIRMALGADHARVVRFILRHSIALAAGGLASGLVAAAAVSLLLQNFLFGMRGLDPGTFGAAVLLFAAIVALASYVPARRAARVDPMSALRAE